MIWIKYFKNDNNERIYESGEYDRGIPGMASGYLEYDTINVPDDSTEESLGIMLLDMETLNFYIN